MQQQQQPQQRSCFMCQDEITPDTYGTEVASDTSEVTYLCDLCYAVFTAEGLLHNLKAEKERRRILHEAETTTANKAQS